MARLPIFLASVLMLMCAATAKDSPSAVNLDVSHGAGAQAGLLTINCSLDGSATDIQTVATLTILGSRPYGSQDEFDELAVVDVWSQEPRLSSELEDANVVIRGKACPDHPSHSFLLLSWNTPTSGYRKVYKCVANGIDSKGQAESVSAIVKVELLGVGGDCCQTIDSIDSELRLVSEKLGNAYDTTGQVMEQVQNFPNRIEAMEKKLEILFAQGMNFQLRLLGIDRRRFLVSDPYKGRVYAVSKQIAGLNVEQANRDCKDEGGYLLEIDDDEEFQFVYDLVTKIGGTNTFWTGGNDIEKEGTFVYYNSKKPVPKLSGWSKGQPNNSGGSENCMEIKLSYKGLNDSPCSLEGKFVCEVSLV